jgi:hypothetical protein
MTSLSRTSIRAMSGQHPGEPQTQPSSTVLSAGPQPRPEPLAPRKCSLTAFGSSLRPSPAYWPAICGRPSASAYGSSTARTISARSRPSTRTRRLLRLVEDLRELRVPLEPHRTAHELTMPHGVGRVACEPRSSFRHNSRHPPGTQSSRSALSLCRAKRTTKRTHLYAPPFAPGCRKIWKRQRAASPTWLSLSASSSGRRLREPGYTRGDSWAARLAGEGGRLDPQRGVCRRMRHSP